MKVCIPLRGRMNILVYGGLFNVSSDRSFSLSRKFADIFVHVICMLSLPPLTEGLHKVSFTLVQSDCHIPFVQ